MTDNYKLEWTVAVKETYQVTLQEAQLPQPVQYALAKGFELDEIACGCSNRHLSEDGGDVLDQAYRALEAFVNDYEEEPTNEEATDVDVVAFSVSPHLEWVRAQNNALRDDPSFWVNEHSDRL